MITQEVAPNIYTFKISLLNNPLKWLNCYVVKGGDRNILIDTGFNHPKCLAELKAGIKELGLTPENTDVIMTHMHSDHTGNAASLQALGYRLYMTEVDYNWLLNPKKPRDMLVEGMPEEYMDDANRTNAALAYTSGPFTCEFISDGDVFKVGEYEFEVIATPGHSNGNICLYAKKQKIMFTGDHVLFDITPNICSNGPGSDTLGDYIVSLKKIRGFDVELALPAHRNVSGMTIYERIDQLIEHHESRLAEVESILHGLDFPTAYEVAGKMHWDIRARDWDTFPVGQKWFAVSEAIAHLNRFIREGMVERVFCDDGIRRYRFVEKDGE